MSELALKLYTFVDGVNDTPFPSATAQAVLTDWQYNAKRMGGTPSITGGTIRHQACLDAEWTEDVYVEYKGEKFFAPHKPTSSYSSQSVMYEHKVDFFSERAVLDNVYFYDVVSEQDSGGKPISNNTKFTFFGTIDEFIVRLNASMARSNTGYSVVLDENQENTDVEKQIKFSEKYISEALQEGFKVFGIPYYFIGKVCHYGVAQSSVLDNMVFEYGRDKSLIAMTKTNANTKIVNRITGVGSQDNIPYFYPNSNEEGMADVSELSSSTITQINVVDDVLLAKKVARNDVLEFGAWEDTTLDIDMFYGDGEAYSWEVPATGADFGGKTVHIVIPLHITFNCTSLALRLLPWAITRPSASVVTYANFTLTPDIAGKAITVSSHDNYVDISASGNIAKGIYTLAFDATFPSLDSEQLIDFSGEDLIEITAIAWQDQQTLALFQDDLSDVGLSIVGTPSSGDTFKRVVSRQVVPQPNLMPSIYRESNGNERFYNATNNTYINPDTGEYYVFPKPYRDGKPKEYIHDEKDIKPSIVNVVNADNEPIDQVIKFAFDENDSDELDENGNYKHPYFFALLHKMDGEFGFNLFDNALEEEEMSIAITSGSLGGCEFVIGVGEDSQKNTVQIVLDENLEPELDEDGHPILKRDANGDVLYGLDGRQSKQVPQSWQNDTRNNEVWVALKKDISTYGIIMPNATYNYKPQEDDEDTFVLLHIDLPKAYILAAEKALEDTLIAFMAESNEEHWNFSIDFSRIYFKETPSVASALDENKRIKIKYNGTTYERYISSYSYKTMAGELLPNISVELAESLQTSSNPIDSAISEISNLVEIQSNAIIGYQQVARLARLALPSANVQNKGNVNLPIYFDGSYAKVIEGLDVPESIRTQKNVEAMWGVSAFGIANMAISGTGGGGTVTAVSVNGNRYTPSNGLITLPDYPTAASLINDGLASRAWAYQNFAAKDYETRVQAIEALIPAQASSENQVADKAFVNSSVATATAEFQGTYDVVEDLGLTASATHAQIQAALLTAVASRQPDNNDYVFVSIPAVGSASGRYERYKFNGTSWAYEYTLNNSSFTAAQWAAITSGITENKVSGYDAHLARTDNPHNVTKAQVGLGNVENTALSTWVGTNKITTLGTITTGVWNGSAIGDSYIASASVWNAKQNALAFDGTYDASTNKVATKSTVTNAINALDVSNISGFGAGKTLASLTETDGKIAATFQDISITKSQVSDFPTTWALADVTGADDLKAIEALTGTSGFLKKTAANTWSLDTDVASGTALSGVSTRVGTLEGYFNNGKLESANIDLATGDDNGQVKIAGTNVSVKGWNTAATHAHGDYVTAVGIDATNGKLKWYLGGVAQTAPNIVAARLVDTNKTMFGNTYWTSSGIPASIGTATAPAALDYVTNIDELIYLDTTGRNVNIGQGGSPANLQAFGGVAAFGIASMAINGGGVGTVTGIKIGNGTTIEPYAGIVTIPMAATNVNGAMSSADKSKLDGIETNANNYTLPVATSDALGGIKIGYGASGKYYAVQLDNNNKAYVYVPWSNTEYTFYNLAFQNASGTQVDIYKPTTSPSKTIKAGSNVTISAASNVITIAAIDTKVTQTVSTSSNTSWRPLIVGYSWNDAETFAPSTVTNEVMASHLAKFAPSTGILAIVGLRQMGTDAKLVTGSANKVFNTNGGVSMLYDWAQASSKPSYAFSEITGTAAASQIPTLAISKISGLQTALDNKLETSLKGAANGLAELDANGLVPSSQLPSYVDDVLEYASKSAFPATGTAGKIYVALDTNLTYRWSGSAYVEISPSLALGETSSTAYRGDRGKTAYDHATETKSGAQNSGFYKFSVTAQGHISGVSAVAASDLTTLIGSTTYAPYNADGYLPLTGGTLCNNANDVPLILQCGSPSYGGTYIQFKKSNGNSLGYIGIDQTDGPVFYNGTRLKIWHAGNDGSGSGLNADLLDGQHGSYYATASSVTTLQGYFSSGVANSAAKLTSNAGSATNPVYFANGVPVACTYSLNKTVPADAVFTDTTYSANNGVGLSGTTFYNSGVRAATINGDYLRINTNGTNADLTIPFATKASQDNDGTAFKGYYLRKVSVPNNTENDFNTFENMTLTGRGDPTTGASLVHAPWSGAGPAGGYGVLTYIWGGCGIQMAWGYYNNHIYIRNKVYNGSTAVWPDSWSTIALTSDNVASATKLQTARSINGTSFNGTADITTANWGTARNISIADSDSTNTGTAVSVNGSAAVTLKLPATIKATLSGNATSATKATNDSDGNAINTTYLKLIGGTLNNGTSDTPLRIKSSNNLGAYIEFRSRNNSSFGYIGVSTNGPIFYDGSFHKIWHESNDGSGSGLDADKLDGQEGSYYATASSVTTLQGYFTSGVANSAAKLTTVSKTAWGQTFWTSGGIPASISGDMSSVGNITPSADKQKNLGSESLQFNYVYASRLITNSGNGLRYCSTTGKHAWYNSYTTDDTTKQMELTNSALTIYKDVQGMGGVSAMGIASMAINSVSGVAFAQKIATNGQNYTASDGTITLPNFTDAYNPSNSGSTTEALSQKGAKTMYTAIINSLPSTSTVAGWGYKKGMVYSTSTASDSDIQVATGADPTYQYITNTSQSTLILVVTTSNAAANSYGVHRYIMIYNNRSSATLVQFADQGQGVVGPADNVSIPANSYMEFRIIHPASNAKCMVTWSTALKNIDTM